MRVLLACSLGGRGHLEPVANVARAVRGLGHHALVLVPPSLVAEIEREELPYEVGDQPPRAVIDEIWMRVRAGPADAVVGLIDRDLFAKQCTPAMVPAARAVRDRWRPDLVVREPCEYASAIAAAEAGIGQAQIGISQAAIDWGVLEMVSPIIEAFCPRVARAITQAPFLTAFPASLDPSPWPHTRRFGPPPAPSVNSLPDWWPDDHRPLVYVTFGSVIGYLPEATAVFRTALDAVAELPGPRAADRRPGSGRRRSRRDPREYPRRAMGHPARHPAARCSGGVPRRLGHDLRRARRRVPVVICPLFADQSANGRVIEDAHAGRVVAGRSLAPGSLQALGPDHAEPLLDAIEQVLTEPQYRQAAKRIAAELAATPTLETILQPLLARPQPSGWPDQGLS